MIGMNVNARYFPYMRFEYDIFHVAVLSEILEIKARESRAVTSNGPKHALICARNIMCDTAASSSLIKP
jgi:hypothetical protein